MRQHSFCFQEDPPQYSCLPCFHQVALKMVYHAVCLLFLVLTFSFPSFQPLLLWVVNKAYLCVPWWTQPSHSFSEALSLHIFPMLFLDKFHCKRHMWHFSWGCPLQYGPRYLKNWFPVFNNLLVNGPTLLKVVCHQWVGLTVHSFTPIPVFCLWLTSIIKDMISQHSCSHVCYFLLCQDTMIEFYPSGTTRQRLSSSISFFCHGTFLSG